MQKDFIEGEEALAAAELWELPNRYLTVMKSNEYHHLLPLIP